MKKNLAAYRVRFADLHLFKKINMIEKEKKKVAIVVNGTPYEVEKDELTYEEVVTLAYADYPQHPERNYSVTYKRGHGNKPEGILSPGAEVKVKTDMIFYVKHTGQS